MSNITFSVIDLSCEAVDRSFFPPRILMTTKSTSTYATLQGYPEFMPSTPPKKYHKITWSGMAERVALTVPDGQSCGGAKFVWSGVGEIDAKGNQSSKYQKNLFAQCNRTIWPTFPLSNHTPPFFLFIGYCWPLDPTSCPVCDPIDTNWVFVGDESTNTPSVDINGFLINPSDKVLTPTSVTINGVFVGDSPPGNLLGSTDSVHFTDDTSALSAVLSDEATDAEALANATIIVGSSATAQNLPRTTGFTSTTTNVVYTLSMSNLIDGTDYLVTVDLWDQPSNIHTTKSYGFTAVGNTHSITDVVPTPGAGHNITVRNPKVVFSP